MGHVVATGRTDSCGSDCLRFGQLRWTKIAPTDVTTDFSDIGNPGVWDGPEEEVIAILTNVYGENREK